MTDNTVPVDDEIPAASNPQRWAATKEEIEFFPGAIKEEDLTSETQRKANAAHDKIMAKAREIEDGDLDDDLGEDEDE